MLSLSFIVVPSRAEQISAVVWTDKKEYYPDETVYIFGYGFTPYSDVNVTVVRPDSVEDLVFASTDQFGYFACEYTLDGVHGTFNVTATDGINTATTSFSNCLHLRVKWKHCCCWYILVRVYAIKPWKSYYVAYFDPNGVQRRTSPTYTGVLWFRDNFTILPSLPNVLGWWTVVLYENSCPKRTKKVYVSRMVWTTNSTYNDLVTSYAQGETLYYYTIGLKSSQYYRLVLEKPSGTRFNITSWTTGITSLTGSYVLPSDAETGSWKLHVREASDAHGTCDHHYVDTCYFEITCAPPPQKYYLTVRTDPPGITTIPGEGWYNASTYVNLTAPELVAGPQGVRYRFDYWDIDGVSQGAGVNTTQVFMDSNHTATAHYVTQYYLNMTTNPPGVTVPAGSGWYDAGTHACIFAPEFVGITPDQSRYRFDGWTTADMSEIADPSATDTTVFMDKAKTVTANYVVQYYVTFDHAGLDDTASGTIVTVNGTSKIFSELPFSMWVDTGSVLTYTYTTTVPTTVSGKRFVLLSITGPASPFTVTGAVTVIGNYKCQYLLTVRTSGLGTHVTNVYNDTAVLGTATDATPYNGWFDKGSLIMLDIDSPITDGSERFVFTHWSGDASGSTRPVSVTMDSAKDITANYKTQFKVIFNQTGVGTDFTGTVVTVDGTDYGVNDLPKEFWWDEGSVHNFDFKSPLIVTVNAKQYVWTSTTGLSTSQSGSITVSTSGSVIGHYKTQYYLTVTSPHGTTGGEGWYDAGATAYATVTPLTVSGPPGVQYVFTHWSGDASGTTSPSDPIIMDEPKTAVANWKTQYYLTVISPYGTPGGEGWYDESTTAYATLDTGIVDHGNGTRRVFTHWGGDASGTDYAQSDPIVMDAPKTAIANWKTQFYLTVETDPAGLSPAPTPSSGWYDSGVDVVLTAPDESYLGSDRYVFSYWDVDGASQGSGVNPITVTMDEPHTATAHYVLPQPPHAAFDYSPKPYPKVDETVTFDASASTPNGGTIISYFWDFGDGEYAYGKIVTHKFTAPGDYVVTLNVTDSEGLWDIETKIITVVQPHGPTASLSATPTIINEGETVHFDASASQPGWNGTHTMPITEYRWDFDGDGVIDEVTSDPIIDHIYYTAGIYYAKVTVYAPGATPETDTATVKITVKTPAPPVVGGYSETVSTISETTNWQPAYILYTVILVALILPVALIRRKPNKSE